VSVGADTREPGTVLPGTQGAWLSGDSSKRPKQFNDRWDSMPGLKIHTATFLGQGGYVHDCIALLRLWEKQSLNTQTSGTPSLFSIQPQQLHVGVGNSRKHLGPRVCLHMGLQAFGL